MLQIQIYKKIEIVCPMTKFFRKSNYHIDYQINKIYYAKK